MQGVGHAVVQRVKVFAGGSGQVELFGNDVQDVLLALGLGQVHIQKVVAKALSGFLQIRHAESADGLDDIGFDGTQWHGVYSFLVRVNPKIGSASVFELKQKSKGPVHFWGALEGLFNQN